MQQKDSSKRSRSGWKRGMIECFLFSRYTFPYGHQQIAFLSRRFHQRFHDVSALLQGNLTASEKGPEAEKLSASKVAFLLRSQRWNKTRRLSETSFRSSYALWSRICQMFLDEFLDLVQDPFQIFPFGSVTKELNESRIETLSGTRTVRGLKGKERQIDLQLIHCSWDCILVCSTDQTPNESL